MLYQYNQNKTEVPPKMKRISAIGSLEPPFTRSQEETTQSAHTNCQEEALIYGYGPAISLSAMAAPKLSDNPPCSVMYSQQGETSHNNLPRSSKGNTQPLAREHDQPREHAAPSKKIDQQESPMNITPKQETHNLNAGKNSAPMDHT
jgi:hypothetical protein